MNTLIYFCFFALILTATEGCKDDANPTTTGGPSANSVTLLTPANDTTIVKIPGGTITFSWSATGSPNHYLLQSHVGTDTNFGTIGEVVTSNSWTHNLSGYIAGYQYSWRVWAIYGADSVVSPVRRFFVTQ
jgi:hypothetical protein